MNRPFILLSYTILKALRCPYYFQKVYILGHEEPDSEAAHMGTVLHYWAAKYGLRLYKLKRPTDKDWFRAFSLKEIEKEPLHLREQMLETAGMFMECFQLDRSADAHHFELRLAVARDTYQPCHPLAQIDRIAGTLDHVAVYSGGKQVSITDYKMGFRLIDFDEVQTDPQLKIYAWLWFKTHPECELVDVKLWGPRWGGNNKSLGEFTRETCADVEDSIQAAWVLIEHYRAEFGDKPWPTHPHWDVCRWCQQECPEYLQNLERYMQEAA